MRPRCRSRRPRARADSRHPDRQAVAQFRPVAGAGVVGGRAVDGQRPDPDTACQGSHFGDRITHSDAVTGGRPLRTTLATGSVERQPRGSGADSPCSKTRANAPAASRSDTAPLAEIVTGANCRKTPCRARSRSSGAVPESPTRNHNEVAPFSRSVTASAAALVLSGSAINERMSQPDSERWATAFEVVGRTCRTSNLAGVPRGGIALPRQCCAPECSTRRHLVRQRPVVPLGAVPQRRRGPSPAR